MEPGKPSPSPLPTQWLSAHAAGAARAARCHSTHRKEGGCGSQLLGSAQVSDTACACLLTAMTYSLQGLD